MIKFEKVKKDALIPKRQSKASAGYDFYINDSFSIDPGESKMISTGIKAKMPENVVLKIYIRSSIGIKKNVVLANSVAIIDSDYYNNPTNDGEIFLTFFNRGSERREFKKHERLAQGIFVQYLTVDKDHNDIVRLGGVGSTGRGKETF